MKKNIKSTKVDPKTPSSEISDDIYDKEFDRAVAFIKKTLKIAEQKEGPNHPSVANVLSHLSVLYHNFGKSTEAVSLLQRALAIREKALGKGHPEVVMTLSDLAIVYDDLGQFSEAETHWKRALEIQEKALGPDHLSVANTLTLIGVSYARQFKRAKAAPFFKRALAIREKGLKPDHPDLVEAMENLARVYTRQKKYFAKAETLFERALEVRGIALIHLEDTILDLIALYKAQGKHSKTKPLKKYLNAIADINTDRYIKLEKIKL